MSAQPIFRTIREQVVHRLRDDILGQVYAPGESLREHSLSKAYGVSRSPIRDALLQLAQEGLLVATPNCGVRVSHRLDEDLQPLVVDVRRRIEGYAIDRAIKRLDEEGARLIKDALEKNRIACSSEDLPTIVKSDMAFHQIIVELSGVPELMSLWQPVIASMMLHYERHRAWMESYREHEEIAKALLAKDRRAAKRALNANIK
ncbi:GntR family transcriptional regulator [Pelagicoccus sp. SDUM812003]|uniref:GntR family transcriptional regulator n=1 Tax=Pelagicoccus sp. SDUM812003 TaxID=3041267 RepID=UPI00280E6ECD|nr:GntR family transcriptional regulator [Pelagicoccus sp. SDUM812003]MDQ8201466.1 GntR family transcriptional regulator [Pelagicoccus sp. SDUM812003]